MAPYIEKRLYAIALTTVFAAYGLASPLNSKLLPLVPAGAQIVSGFENRPGSNSHGRLLLTTHNNRLDLDDWQALVGVDSKRYFDEVIEVAASPLGPDGVDLSEHLLMVHGSFDRDRIFRAAELNGAQRGEYLGEMILVIKPFPREKEDMLAARWMAILDNRTGMLGTPMLVQQSLQRYATHAYGDAVLMERLTQFRHDITSWNVLLSSRVDDKRIIVTQAHTGWAHLLEDAEVLLVGARFGSRVRVDFLLHAKSDRGGAFFTQKASSFADGFAAERARQAGISQPVQRRLTNLSADPGHIQGSIEMSSKDYDAWSAEVNRFWAPHGLAPGAATEN